MLKFAPEVRGRILGTVETEVGAHRYQEVCKPVVARFLRHVAESVLVQLGGTFGQAPGQRLGSRRGCCNHFKRFQVLAPFIKRARGFDDLH